MSIEQKKRLESERQDIRLGGGGGVIACVCFSVWSK